MPELQRVVPGESRVIQTDAGIIAARPVSRVTAMHLGQFGVDRVVSRVFKNTVPGVDAPARVDMRVIEVGNELADRAPKKQSTNLTGNLLTKSGNAEPAVAR